MVPQWQNGTPIVHVAPLLLKGGIGLRISVDGTGSLLAVRTGPQSKLELAGNQTKGPVLVVRLNASGEVMAVLEVMAKKRAK